MRWNDNLAIPKGSGRIEDAHKLIDYYYDPAAATTLSEYIGYFTPVAGVDQRIVADAEAAREEGDTETRGLLRRPCADRRPDRGPARQHLRGQAADRGGRGRVE